MFSALKEKIKSWLSKNSTEEKENLVKKEKKEERKKEKRDKNKEISRKKEKNKKKEEKEEKKSFFDRFVKKEKVIEEEKEEFYEEQIKDYEEKEEKKSFFDRFVKKLDEEKFEEMFSELEMILLQNNTAYASVESIKNSLKKKLVGRSLKEIDLKKELKESIKSILIEPPDFIEKIKNSLKEKTPFVILFAGINGSGKTTTIAKIAHLLKKNNISSCLAASDTFRAAAIQQLEEHAKKLNVPIIKKDYGADPASVGFDAISYAKKHKIDVVLIDTAGRLQNKDSLMKEMEKIVRVTKPDMKIFVGESITGNDVTEQSKIFNETIDITGIILSKADVDEKGGTAISVSSVTGKPILFLGTGQTYNDLEIFNKEKILKDLGL